MKGLIETNDKKCKCCKSLFCSRKKHCWMRSRRLVKDTSTRVARELVRSAWASAAEFGSRWGSTIAKLIHTIVTTCDAALTAHFRHIPQLNRQSIVKDMQRAANTAKQALQQSREDPLMLTKMIQMGISGQDLCQELSSAMRSCLSVTRYTVATDG